MKISTKQNKSSQKQNNSGKKLLSQLPILMLASTFLYNNPSLAAGTTTPPAVDTDSGIWKITYASLAGYSLMDTGTDIFQCKVNPDGSFQIKEVYEHTENNLYNADLQTYHRRELTSSDGNNYHVEEYQQQIKYPLYHVKTQDWVTPKTGLLWRLCLSHFEIPEESIRR